MATKIPQPVTHIFKEVNKSKYRFTKHFELVKVKNGNSLLLGLINLSKNRNFALSIPDYWLKIRQEKKWSKPVTGLFKTDVRFVYWGDENKRQNLLIFKFSDDVETLTVYYFQNYFTNDLIKVLPVINKCIKQIKRRCSKPSFNLFKCSVYVAT